MEFDHLFICVEAPANEAGLLLEFGLTEGTANTHAGQGTANRRFFFQNSCIELLFVTDRQELVSDLTKPTHLHKRFPHAQQNASPFGLCFRPTADEETVPFQSWRYKPQYPPPELDIAIGNAPSKEPMWFYLSFGYRPDSAAIEKRQPLLHNCGFENITSVEVIASLSESFSQPGSEVNKVPGVEFRAGEEHLLKIGFDSELQGHQKDFRPLLPLIFRW